GGEDISRAAYNARLLGPLRKALADRRDKVKVLLSVYGVPLRVGAEEPGPEDRAELARLKPRIDALQGELRALQEEIASREAGGREEPRGTVARPLEGRRREGAGWQEEPRPLERARRRHSHADSHAAVDSELMLLWWDDYDLRGWQPNLLYFQVG